MLNAVFNSVVYVDFVLLLLYTPHLYFFLPDHRVNLIKLAAVCDSEQQLWPAK